ncbi:hypothetical protein LCGC14_0370970 [marine sediment metagenome]|uniref:DUF551 domain-containing protein n=1 Tax=marine sediment metagenome TaxID=412755 RepID=A0A0F9VSH8_9ZZZZ|nr:DUF551 domain-containing protein [Maribacter sp.]
MEWISVEEKLPERTCNCLVAYTNNSQSVGVAYFHKIHNFMHIRTENHYYTVTHWMPLPDPPKPKQP